MKRILLLFVLIFILFSASAQTALDPFVGTWVYQKNDTVFKIKLQKATALFPFDYPSKEAIVGGYSLSVKGVLKDNYIKQMPSSWKAGKNSPLLNIFLFGYYIKETKVISFIFFDQQIKHDGGDGIPGGKMKLIAPDKLHWILNEKEGLWWQVEGTDKPYELKGFSVPVDVIMTKEE